MSDDDSRVCDVCNRTFVNWHAYQQHCTAVGHWECDGCSATFYSYGDVINHERQFGHSAPQFDCEACSGSFNTLAAAKQHMRLKDHFRVHFCKACSRGFESEQNLKAHLNSRLHRGGNMSCPFCKRGFATATGVTHHLETGSCPNARSLNRDTILTEIRRRDPGHLITKKLLTYHDTPSSITVTSASWNPHASCYECYLCHKLFRELKSLNAHVNSPAHKEKVYHCPGRACSREFRALAALFNHLESETCGTVRFETVQRNVGHILSGQRMIAFV